MNTPELAATLNRTIAYLRICASAGAVQQARVYFFAALTAIKVPSHRHDQLWQTALTLHHCNLTVR